MDAICSHDPLFCNYVHVPVLSYPLQNEKYIRLDVLESTNWSKKVLPPTEYHHIDRAMTLALAKALREQTLQRSKSLDQEEAYAVGGILSQRRSA